MNKRKPLGKKVRFDIFKRDMFACQYCGRTPPAVTLEVDHLHPVFEGGDNSEDNLITACFDCNRGKGKEKLSVTPQDIAEKMQVKQEKIEQLKAYEKILRSEKAAIKRKVKKVEAIFQEYYEASFTDKFNTSVALFVSKLPVTEVEEAMEIATSATSESESCAKYFCGVCWSKIRENENG